MQPSYISMYLRNIGAKKKRKLFVNKTSQKKAPILQNSLSGNTLFVSTQFVLKPMIYLINTFRESAMTLMNQRVPSEKRLEKQEAVKDVFSLCSREVINFGQKMTWKKKWLTFPLLHYAWKKDLPFSLMTVFVVVVTNLYSVLNY